MEFSIKKLPLFSPQPFIEMGSLSLPLKKIVEFIKISNTLGSMRLKKSLSCGAVKINVVKKTR